ncbi:MAG: ABC transporter permease [Thalassobaculales bacterium]
MTPADAVRAALQALRANLLRSLLTMLGIIIGVAAVIAVAAIGAGAREQVLGKIRSLGANLIVVWPGSITTGGARLGAGARSTLTEDDATALLRDLPQLEAVTAQVRAPNMQYVRGNQNWSTGTWGVTLDYFIAREWVLAEGRLWTPDEERAAAKVIVLGRTVVDNLFGEDEEVIGQEIRIRDVPLQVIGVLERKGQTLQGSDQDDAGFAPLLTTKRRLMGRNRANPRAVGSILMKVREGEDMAAAEADIRALLRQRHRLPADAGDDFNLRNLSEVGATVDASAQVLTLFLTATAAVSLLVGGIGVMNIMLVSVTERTREIGLRLAIGARRRDILRQFLVEATTLATIGGLIGVPLGAVAARAVADIGGWPVLVEPGVVVVAVVFSGMIGVFFGYWPARRAALLDPIEALRHE